jgi:vacuolar-type H+-ATPase subunit E/Vma4
MSKLESGVDQLIERVKTQGIEKALEEGTRYKKAAIEEAEDIIRAAKIKAEIIIKDAKTQIDLERDLFTKETQLAARDFCLKLSERLRKQLILPVIKENVRATLKEPSFLKEVLLKLCVDYVKENPSSIDVLVPKELKITLSSFMQAAIFDYLDKNPPIRLIGEDGLDGFLLIRRDDNFIWDFRVKTVAEEIMRLLEPFLRKYFVVSEKFGEAPEKQVVNEC